MAIPNSRAELKGWILRSLGSPVISINIDESQIDDRIDDALKMWQEYHAEGSQRVYIAHEITQDDIDNDYITLGDNIYAVNRVLTGNNGNGYSRDFIFNIEYQLRLSDLFDLRYADIGGYYIGKQYIDMLDSVLRVKEVSSYNRYERRVRIEGRLNKIPVGQFVLIDAYQFLDPEEFNHIYGDRIFKKLCAAYCKKQWGENLMKFKNVPLPGGMVLNGEMIFYEGKSEIAEIETNFRRNYSDPDLFFVG